MRNRKVEAKRGNHPARNGKWEAHQGNYLARNAKMEARTGNRPANDGIYSALSGSGPARIEDYRALLGAAGEFLGTEQGLLKLLCAERGTVRAFRRPDGVYRRSVISFLDTETSISGTEN